MSAWDLYDKLIGAVPDGETVAECFVSPSWVCIKTESGRCGLNAVQPGPALDTERLKGMPLKEAAKLSKSWRFNEAAAGCAAINAAFNFAGDFTPKGEQDAFLRYRERLTGKRVACIGHFAYLEQRLKGLCELTILERRPSGDDLPDPAAEYLLPEMDAVFITGSALANKTMPRLLELTKNAFTVVSGPSTPMAPVLLELGVDALCGFCVTDEEKMHECFGGNGPVFGCGRMVCLERE